MDIASPLQSSTSDPDAPTGSTTSNDNSLKLLIDEPTAFPVIYDAIRNARSSVNITMFSMLPDGTGAQLAALLKQKAQEGVEVNLQVDELGSLMWKSQNRRFIRSIEQAGVHVVRNEHGGPFDGNHTDHRKLYIIDGETAFLGGMNLGARYDTWHDVMTRVQGPAVAAAAAMFVQRWEHDGGKVTALQKELLSRPQRPTGAADVAILENQPGSSGELTADYVHAISSAKRQVRVSTPYIGDERFATALEAAARRGVDVRLYTTSSTAKGLIPGMTMLSRSFYPRLLEAGVKIYEEPRMAHAKLLVTDDRVSVGSMNLTRASAMHDYELNIATRDPAFRARALAMFESDQARATPISAHDLNSPLDRVLAFLRETLHIQH